MINKRTQGGEGLQRREAQAILQGIQATPLGSVRWRISPEPFWIRPGEVEFFKELGNHLLAFYRALNDLYHESVQGRLPQWISRYLDQGKPSDLVAYGRMNRIRDHLPGIIRPDLIATDHGYACTELDSVPGGFGMTGCLSRLYSGQGFSVIGGGDGILKGFAEMVRSVAGHDRPNLAIVVSDESRDYLSEMQWLGAAVRETGISASVIGPRDLEFTEAGFFVRAEKPAEDHKGILDNGRMAVEVLYRFFELFDLKNIPKAELILYAAKKKQVALTPPAKAYLEEKMAFAFFHHPVLREFWIGHLGEPTFNLLHGLFPKTWILDPQEVPPYAVIPGLQVGDRWITDWAALGRLGQKERRFVIKPSGFSPLAWGSRGVRVGHDVSENDWQRTVESALRGFEQTPYILQEFHKGRRVEVKYYDEVQEVIREMSGRVRMTPYYFVTDQKAELGGVLATACPLDKKLLHGMSDAVMVPCGVKEQVS